jgi:hypothetical protein
MRMRREPGKFRWLAALLCLAPAPAVGAELFSRSNLSGVVVAGVSAGTGEESWLAGGLGKLQAGGDSGGADAQAILVWRANFTQRLGATVTLDAQTGTDPAAGLDEAYLTWRAAPQDELRLFARAGLFFPPVSLEHDGSDWSLTHTLTPSAINSWIAEEVKVAGLEATVRGAVAGMPAAATVAAFRGNDTAGTLLAFRGWALHDRRATLGATFGLPTLPAMFVGAQSTSTRPVDEVDGRWGGYARLDLAPAEGLSLNLFGYDNHGDRLSVVDGQYAWRTRFAQTSASWRVDDRLLVMGQAMIGESTMGARMAGLKPANVGFASAYVLVSRDLPLGAATARIDRFSVSDRTFKQFDNNAEQGWAATLAWTASVTPQSQLVLEGTAARSMRRDRERFGLNPRQNSLQTRIAVRTVF